jgi:hypothetical protein
LASKSLSAVSASRIEALRFHVFWETRSGKPRILLFCDSPP